MSKQILVVDDNRNIRRLVSLFLQKEGHKVYTAPNVDEGLDIARKTQLDLILMDVMMPRKTGYQGIRELQDYDETKRVPIILITAKAVIRHTSKEMMWRVYGYLTKPFTNQELIAIVDEVLMMTKSMRKAEDAHPDPQ